MGLSTRAIIIIVIGVCGGIIVIAIPLLVIYSRRNRNADRYKLVNSEVEMTHKK